jgi:predicted transcriptional regulator
VARREKGRLEAEVLQVLWSSDVALTAAEVRAALDPVPALTTVLTVLDRLAEKGEVRRDGEARRGVHFVAARSEQEHRSIAMTELLDASSDRAGTLLRFAGSLDDEELAVLRRALDERRG